MEANDDRTRAVARDVDVGRAVSALVLDGIRHAHGALPVLDGVALEVGAGEIVAVLGASGCGKTTLLRAVAGLVTPDGGRVEIGGRVVTDGGRVVVPVEQRRVGLVFQEHALFPSLDVSGNIGFGLRPRDPARVDGLLQRVGLAGLGGRRVSELSGGQQQRVAIARALAPRAWTRACAARSASSSGRRSTRRGQPRC
jgi:iron(III) transport system ATP-binding protein